MTRSLILLFTLVVIMSVHSTNACCEGKYTTDIQEIIRGVEYDKSIWVAGIRALKYMFLPTGVPFKDICKDCSEDEKLSVCIKAVQHKWKILKPISLTVKLSESNFVCKPKSFIGKDSKINYQRMYDCPETTLKVVGFNGIEKLTHEPPFLIGQGLHSTQYRIRIFNSETIPASIEDQVTGLKLNALTFQKHSDELYTYTPVYNNENNDLICLVFPFREIGSMDDYITVPVE